MVMVLRMMFSLATECPDAYPKAQMESKLYNLALIWDVVV